jgi:hypothetical protein
MTTTKINLTGAEAGVMAAAPGFRLRAGMGNFQTVADAFYPQVSKTDSTEGLPDATYTIVVGGLDPPIHAVSERRSNAGANSLNGYAHCRRFPRGAATACLAACLLIVRF